MNLDLLSRVALFEGLSQGQLKKLAGVCETERVPSDPEQDRLALVRECVRRARVLLNHRHLAEGRPRAEDGQRLLTHPGQLA